MNDSPITAALPIPDRDTEAYWEAAREHRLLIQRNPNTGSFQSYPRPFCLDDRAVTPEWVEASGRGKVHSFSVVRRSGMQGVPAPYVHALIELEEGPIMTANLVDTDLEAITIDMPVEVVFCKASEEIVLPMFKGVSA